MNRVLVIAAMTFAVALPLHAQTDQNDFETIVAGKAAPLTIHLGDLDTSWCRMTPTTTDKDILLQMMLGTYSRNSPYVPDYFYTQGKTVSVAGEPFVITYRLVQAEAQISRPAAYDEYSPGTQNLVIPPALSKSTTLQLSLISPRLTGRFDNIQTSDAAKEIAQSQKVRIGIVNQLSLTNLQRIGQFFSTYRMSKGKLPALKDATTLQNQLVKGNRYVSYISFIQPDTQKPYRTNAALSSLPMKSLKNPATSVVFYEGQVSLDGTRGVLFANGQVQRVKEAEFARLLKESVPLTGMMSKQKVVPLYGAAALAYLYETSRPDGKGIQYYRSEANGRIYYREAKTKQAIYVAPPAKPILVPVQEAAAYAKYAGYNGQKNGQKFGGYGYSPK